MIKRWLFILAALGLFAQPLAAEECQSLDTLNDQQTARQLASEVRKCVFAEQYEDAVRIFFAYSNFILYDVQRVWDQSAHVVVPELNEFALIGYSYDQTNALKAVIDRMRDPESEFLSETCRAIAKAGPPAYRPTYMIRRGEAPRRSDEDWATQDFDSNIAWRKTLIDVNKCPEGTFPS